MFNAGAVLTTLYFLRNLRLGPISKSVCSWLAFQASSNVCKYATCKKGAWVGSGLTRKLQTRLKRPVGNQHYSLLVPFVNYEENEVL